ncbi:ABC transporter substrate-binding protein [Dongshaea marina]|uniref:ABC transporter substrate-binding protein n=1 Tax=Dongshaea marina TaxID=2047966 RepID=UPI000D3E7617|nr:ABC transporter substrate-binding protein [Dongshaea marina]
MKKLMMILLLVFSVLSIHSAQASPAVADQASSATSERKSIAVFTTREQDDMFWGLVYGLMEQACDQLGMRCVHYYAQNSHIRMEHQAKEAIESGFDAIVVPNFKKRLPVIVKMANEAKVPIFTFNSGFLPDDNMGSPREKYKYWIGEMLPDDSGAGYQLAEILTKQAKKIHSGVNMVALLGNIADMASIQRQIGLVRYLEDHPEVELKQIVYANWSPDMAAAKASRLNYRYPDINVFWSASDGMAIGVLHALGKKEFITGGVDWSVEGIDMVKSNPKMIATMGGHILEGAWVAVILYDYFHGKDFADETLQFRSPMMAITKQNVDEMKNKLARRNWKNIDFTSYSKVKNPSIKKYDFTLK